MTAFLLVGLPAKPYWNSSLLGPRFLASAFSAGPAFILILLSNINKYTEFKIQKKTISKLALIVTIAAQINLVMLFSEVFKEFYQPTEHSRSARYLFFGIGEYNNLVVWIWISISMDGKRYWFSILTLLVRVALAIELGYIGNKKRLNLNAHHVAK